MTSPPLGARRTEPESTRTMTPLPLPLGANITMTFPAEDRPPSDETTEGILGESRASKPKRFRV